MFKCPCDAYLFDFLKIGLVQFHDGGFDLDHGTLQTPGGASSDQSLKTNVLLPATLVWTDTKTIGRLGPGINMFFLAQNKRPPPVA